MFQKGTVPEETENNSEAQSRRVLSGNQFEREIFEYIKNEIEHNSNIILLKPRTQVYLRDQIETLNFLVCKFTPLMEIS